MGEPLSQEKLPGEVKKPLRITLTFTTTRGDSASLDPLWKAILSPRMFEIARRYRASSPGKSFVILSDQADLSITFPHLPDAAKTFGSGFVIGSVAGLLFFFPGTIPLLWVPIMAVLGGFAGMLTSRSASIQITVRGDLPDIVAHSPTLASWLAAGGGRKMHLETVDKIYVEADAKTPEEIESMFKAAIAAYEHGADSAGSTA